MLLEKSRIYPGKNRFGGEITAQHRNNLIARGELLGVAALGIIGLALIVLAPAEPSGERVSAVGA
jgi:hypothetical protein